MIIVNQDRTDIINFDRVCRIGIENPLEDNDGKYKIIAETDTSEFVLGGYQTEEKALGILNNIYVRYGMFEYYKQVSFKMKQVIEKDFIRDDVVYNCFEMPEE